MWGTMLSNLSLEVIKATTTSFLVRFPYAIAGYSFVGKLTDSKGATEVASFTVDVNDVDNEVTFTLSAATTTGLAPGDLYGYVQQTDGSGNVSALFNLRGRISRPGGV